MKMKFVAAVIVFLLLLQVTCFSKTIRVPQDEPDMRMALRDAYYGDTVLVYPGKYRVQERVRSGVTVISVAGKDSTTLWNRRWHILLLNDCDMETLISGFTFQGRGSNACIVCSTGAPVITDNIILDSWDGIGLYRSNAFVKGNLISGCNRGIHLDESNAEILENEITRNPNGISLISSAPVIARNLIKSNGRGILVLGHSYPIIGGSLTTANHIISNSFDVYNEGLQIDGALFTDRREVCVATHNYWGSNCPKPRFQNDVVYRPWTNATRDSLFNECPEEAAKEEE
jgi:parallel beta-helix repeat protein